ncbi:MAG: MarR family transcriptional regulator, partial [Zymomonas sp.]|nr:MarR family transcriptional regulator [Zymomonas sp.]
RSDARGLGAGAFLLAETIARARVMGADKLYLLTSNRCEAAIHLYEQAGFEHDTEIMRDYGACYDRCDVAMRYRPR